MIAANTHQYRPKSSRQRYSRLCSFDAETKWSAGASKSTAGAGSCRFSSIRLIIHQPCWHYDQIIGLNRQVLFQPTFIPDLDHIDHKGLRRSIGVLASKSHIFLVRKITEPSRVQNRLADGYGLTCGDFKAAFVAHLAGNVHLAHDASLVDHFEANHHRGLMVKVLLQQSFDVPGQLLSRFAQCLDWSKIRHVQVARVANA